MSIKHSSVLCAPVVLFLTCLVATGCLPNPLIPARTAHALYILTSIHTSRDLTAWIKMLNVLGRWSLVTGWNWALWTNPQRGSTEVELKDSVSQCMHAGTLQRWSWRNLFRTPSARSGATALYRKLHGPRTKVSAMLHNNNVIVQSVCFCNRVIMPEFQLCDTQRGFSSERVNVWVTKIYGYIDALELKGPLVTPHMHTVSITRFVNRCIGRSMYSKTNSCMRKLVMVSFSRSWCRSSRRSMSRYESIL